MPPKPLFSEKVIILIFSGHMIIQGWRRVMSHGTLIHQLVRTHMELAADDDTVQISLLQ